MKEFESIDNDEINIKLNEVYSYQANGISFFLYYFIFILTCYLLILTYNIE